MVFDQFGGNDVLYLTDLPVPEPKPGEILMKIAYAGTNPVDWKICAGWLKKRIKTEFPATPGFDAAGVVEALGDGVDQFQVGDRVYTDCLDISHTGIGTYAEFLSAPAGHMAKMPQSLNFKEAAAVPLVALTAWQALFDKAKLKKGETILIQAGAGGVGSIAIQLAKWAGATVYTTASPGNHDYVRSLGADVPIDYHSERIQDVIDKDVKGGFDVVLDCVGENVFDESLKVVRKGGWLVTICKFFIEESLSEKYGIRTGFVFVQPSGKQLQTISKMFDQGVLIPPELTEYPLEEAAKAWDQLRTGHTRGKVVLKINEMGGDV